MSNSKSKIQHPKFIVEVIQNPTFKIQNLL